MITSSNGNIFRVPGHLCTKASDAEHWCFLSSAPDLAVRANGGEAADLSRHRAHYDDTVMIAYKSPGSFMYKYYLYFEETPIKAEKKMATIFLTTFSNEFSRIKMLLVRFKIPSWNLFEMV